MSIRYQFVELFRDAKSETDINRKTHLSHMKIDHWLSKNCPCDSDLILEKNVISISALKLMMAVVVYVAAGAYVC